MQSSSASFLGYAWILIVLWAALAQTARNTARRSLVAQAGTLGMVEVVFSYLVSRRLLREKLAPAEQVGLVLVLTGVAALLFS